ncbi:MAG: YHYH protein [Myxococcota bacterium]|nr:YHYH protein [Myxococcota bacterium]
MRSTQRVFFLATLCLGLGCSDSGTSFSTGSTSGIGSDAGDTTGSGSTTDAGGTTDSTDTSDGSDAVDSSSSADASDALDNEDTSDTSDSSDASVSSDTSDGMDITDGTDTSDGTTGRSESGDGGIDTSIVIVVGGDDPNVPASSAGDFCSDDSLGSATTALPEAPDSPYAFTTILRECSLNRTEAAQCYGAAHASEISVSNGVRTITGNAIPNHDCDLYPNMGNPNAVSAQNKSYDVTTTPSKGNTSTWTRSPGVGVNGIKYEPQTAERYGDTEWSYEALLFAGQVATDPNNFPGTSLGLDCNAAHVQPTGEYHYHGVPMALMPDSKQVVQVGWAADGFPVLARYGYSTIGDQSSEVVELRGSYTLKDGEREALGNETPPPGEYDGTFVQDWEYNASVGDLDECNGRIETITIAGETFEYAYYLTLTYPFMPRCVWGDIIDNSFIGAGGGGTGGGTGAPGGGTTGPASCTQESDCDDACPEDAALGCTCHTTPMGAQLCLAQCGQDSDCPSPVGVTLICNNQGICVPEGGPGGGMP